MADFFDNQNLQISLNTFPYLAHQLEITVSSNELLAILVMDFLDCLFLYAFSSQDSVSQVKKRTLYATSGRYLFGDVLHNLADLFLTTSKLASPIHSQFKQDLAEGISELRSLIFPIFCQTFFHIICLIVNI